MRAISLQPGHDGNPPVLEELRDRDGRGKRETPTQLVRYDQIDRLLGNKVIDPHHGEAARMLQWDTEQAEGLRSSSTTAGGTGGKTFTLSDHRIAAMERQSSARASVKAALGPLAPQLCKLITFVVLENKTLRQCAKLLGENERAMGFGLRSALEMLARHYRLA